MAMIAGGWCLNAAIDPSVTKSLENGQQLSSTDHHPQIVSVAKSTLDDSSDDYFSDVVAGAGHGRDPTLNETLGAYQHPHVIHHHHQQRRSPSHNRHSNTPTRALAAAAEDYNNMVAHPYSRRNNNSSTFPHRINTSSHGVGIDASPLSPTAKKQPPGYSDRWNSTSSSPPKRINHRSHTNPTSPLTSERKTSRLLRRNGLNRTPNSNTGRNNDTSGVGVAGGPPGMVTMTMPSTCSPFQQQQEYTSSPRKPLHLQQAINERNHKIDEAAAVAEQQPQLVCDYDTSATGLYELLESSNWEEARNRCRSHPQEVRTWIVRKDKSLKVRWKLLPLHAAIIFQCPNFVVAALLDQYPAAISSVDDQGMLPLHLAFRHKHEDEDLLELLLVQHPKAVLVKDKRNRVPLEHGRDCKFSAKFTRLYADALIAGSRAQNNVDHSHNNNNNNNNLSPRHGDQVTAKTSLNTSFRMDPCGTTTTGYNEEAAVQQRIQQQRQHDAELRRMREQYEGEIKQLREQHKQESHEQAVVAKDERHSLIEEHKREVSDLRAAMAKQENSMVRDLKTQISELQRSLESSQRDRNHSAAQCERLEAFHIQVKRQMYDIVQDQVAIRDLVMQQERDLESARQMRSQIVRTLMQQEDTDGQNDRATTEKVMQMGESVRGRIQTLLDHDPMANSGVSGGSAEMPIQAEPMSNLRNSRSTSAAVAPPPPPPPLPPKVPPPPTGQQVKHSKLQQNANAKRVTKMQMRGPSRVEVLRSNDEQEGGIEVHGVYKQERKTFHHHLHGSNLNNNNNRILPESRQAIEDEVGNDDALRDARSLGDDISAITEMSP